MDVETLGGVTLIALLIKVKNLMLLLWYPRRFLNARWADIVADSAWHAFDFAGNQFYRVYLRWSAKYRYHPQQTKHSLPHNFDPGEALAKRMEASGTGEYYGALPSTRNALNINKTADLTSHGDCESIHGVLQVVASLAEATSPDQVSLVGELVKAGLTRAVDVDDEEDWELLREQLRISAPEVQLTSDTDTKQVYPFALSYKKGEETFISEVSIRRRGEGMDEDMEEEQEQTWKLMRTSDFLDDRRWDQMKRGVREYAKLKNYTKVSLWMDKVRNIGRTKEEKKEIWKKLNWTEFGLYPYILMPTIRVYDPSEDQFHTAFWRKVETTLAVSGKGLICDDYMIRKYDGSVHYDQALYQRLRNGIIILGGKNKFVRSTILAFATMIITDGVAITKSNEHANTRKSIVMWKSWAIRCITQEAFADHAPAVPVKNEPPNVSLDAFKLLTSWEYDVCHCGELTGGSYLNMTLQRALSYSRASKWNSVSEWIGMMQSAFIMDTDTYKAARSYLNSKITMEMYAAPSGHTVTRFRLMDNDRVHKTLVVETARFSTAVHGQVLAIADATSHSGKSIVAWYLRLTPDPDTDQECKIEDGEVIYSYKFMKVRLALWIQYLLLFLVAILFLGVGAGLIGALKAIFWAIGFPLLLYLIAILLFRFLLWPWPWTDMHDVGEALFDNVILDSLYDSGIKEIYRQVRPVEYKSIQWH